MPKKKKSRTQESKHVPSVTTHGNLELRKREDIPDENALKEMKEKLLNEKPEFRQMFQYMEKLGREGTKQAQDSSVVFTNRRGSSLFKYYL
jgi:acetyl-CoA carboxylase beta subunit